VKKAPKAPASRRKAGAPPAAKSALPPAARPSVSPQPQAPSAAPSPELMKLADYINPRALDAAQMVMVVSAALQSKDGTPPPLGEEVRTGLIRILQEVTDIIMGIKSHLAAAVHPS
jgi:hypothetical protein